MFAANNGSHPTANGDDHLPISIATVEHCILTLSELIDAAIKKKQRQASIDVELHRYTNTRSTTITTLAKVVAITNCSSQMQKRAYLLAAYRLLADIVFDVKKVEVAANIKNAMDYVLKAKAPRPIPTETLSAIEKIVNTCLLNQNKITEKLIVTIHDHFVTTCDDLVDAYFVAKQKTFFNLPLAIAIKTQILFLLFSSPTRALYYSAYVFEQRLLDLRPQFNQVEAMQQLHELIKNDRPTEPLLVDLITPSTDPKLKNIQEENSALEDLIRDAYELIKKVCATPRKSRTQPLDTSEQHKSAVNLITKIQGSLSLIPSLIEYYKEVVVNIDGFTLLFSAVLKQHEHTLLIYLNLIQHIFNTKDSLRDINDVITIALINSKAIQILQGRDGKQSMPIFMHVLNSIICYMNVMPNAITIQTRQQVFAAWSSAWSAFYQTACTIQDAAATPKTLQFVNTSTKILTLLFAWKMLPREIFTTSISEVYNFIESHPHAHFREGHYKTICEMGARIRTQNQYVRKNGIAHIKNSATTDAATTDSATTDTATTDTATTNTATTDTATADTATVAKHKPRRKKHRNQKAIPTPESISQTTSDTMLSKTTYDPSRPRSNSVDGVSYSHYSPTKTATLFETAAPEDKEGYFYLRFFVKNTFINVEKKMQPHPTITIKSKP